MLTADELNARLDRLESAIARVQATFRGVLTVQGLRIVNSQGVAVVRAWASEQTGEGGLTVHAADGQTRVSLVGLQETGAVAVRDGEGRLAEQLAAGVQLPRVMVVERPTPTAN